MTTDAAVTEAMMTTPPAIDFAPGVSL